LNAQGSLAERDLAELVLELYKQRFSGLLVLSNLGIGKNLTLQEGRMVFASSTRTDHRLGEILLRKGRLSEEKGTEVRRASEEGSKRILERIWTIFRPKK